MTEDVDTIYIWPDGTWCYQDELEDYGFMSDDYCVTYAPCDWSEDDIDTYAERLGKGLPK